MKKFKAIQRDYLDYKYVKYFRNHIIASYTITAIFVDHGFRSRPLKSLRVQEVETINRRRYYYQIIGGLSHV